MAGMWIPWEIGLTRKREVMMIARTMGVSRREAAAACMEVWEWASDQSVDGLIVGMEKDDVSEAVGIPGIAEAMDAVGWLVNGNGNVQFPNWDRFNSRSARARYLNAARVRRCRADKAKAKHDKGAP